jgi:hypothetical protein
MNTTQRDQLIGHLVRRLGRLEEADLARLELLTRPEEPNRNRGPLSRRLFMQLALAGGAAATGAAALRAASLAPAAPTAAGVVQGSAPVVGDVVTSQSADVADLLAQLSAAQTEIVNLRGSLSESAQQALGLQGQLDGALGELDLSRGQLAEATGANQVLKGLVGLYEQLDGINVEDTVLGGLASAGEQLSSALEHSTIVQSGVDAARATLDGFEGAFAPVHAALSWLGAVLAWLTARVGAIEETLGQTVSAGRAFSELVASFFVKILSLLPFGWGDPIKRGLDAIGLLLNGVPDVVQGVNSYVLGPLDAWFNPERPTNLSATVVGPVRSSALDPAATLVQRVGDAQSSYATQLDAPARTVIADRQKIREAIAQYRAQNGL